MAGKILKIVETFDEIGSLVDISPPQPKNTKLYYKLGSVINPDTYSPKTVSDLLGSNALRLSPDLYDELMNIFEEYDKTINDEDFRLYTIRNNNKQAFDIFNTENNKNRIYIYLENLMGYISSRPNPEVTVFYEDLNRRIANKINTHINPYYGVTLLSLGPQTIEDIIPPFVLDDIPGKYRYNIVVIGNESNQKDIIRAIKILKKNKDTEGYFNIMLFTGKVYLPSLSEPVNTRIDFVDSFINNLSISSKHIMYWGTYACGDITNYITDARRMSRNGYTVYGKNMLVKNGHVCSLSANNLLIDSRDMYTYDKSKLYTSLITFTRHFIGSLTVVLNYTQQDIHLTDWKNSLEYDPVKVETYGKQFETEHTNKLSETNILNEPTKLSETNILSDKDRISNKKLSESSNMYRQEKPHSDTHPITGGSMGMNAVSRDSTDKDNEDEEHVYSFESILNNADNSSINNTVSVKSSSDNATESDTSNTQVTSPYSSEYLIHKLKEYYHKYDKYKYKHEMLRRRVINILRRDGNTDLLNEILKYD